MVLLGACMNPVWILSDRGRGHDRGRGRDRDSDSDLTLTDLTCKPDLIGDRALACFSSSPDQDREFWPALTLAKPESILTRSSISAIVPSVIMPSVIVPSVISAIVPAFWTFCDHAFRDLCDHTFRDLCHLSSSK